MSADLLLTPTEILPRITAYNQESEAWRIKRLSLMCDLLKYYAMHKNVVSLHDNKGELSVIWENHPNDELERRRVEHLWSGAFFEPLVRHLVACELKFCGAR